MSEPTRAFPTPPAAIPAARPLWSPVATTTGLVVALSFAVALTTLSTSAIEIEAPATERILEDARELTRGQEGLVLSPYHPTSGSGVTIAFGYDMRDKTAAGIATDLESVDPPIDADWIARLSAAAGLSGPEADGFVDRSSDIVLSETQALDLFERTYARETEIARDFATNPDEYSQYGVTYPEADWRHLHPAIRGILIDLKYRGDYRPWVEAQAVLQERVAANDPEGVLEQVRLIDIFPADLATVAPARFEARIAWMERILGRR